MIHRNRMPETIDTERLLLRQATIDDAFFYYQLTNSEGWLRFIGDRHIHNQEAALKYIAEHYINAFMQNGFGVYFVTLKKTKQTVGVCGIIQRDELPSRDIGFALLPVFETKGIAFEAANAVIFEFKLSFPNENLLAITNPENIKSSNLLKRLGFVHLKDIFIETGGVPAKVLLYALPII